MLEPGAELVAPLIGRGWQWSVRGQSLVALLWSPGGPALSWVVVGSVHPVTQVGFLVPL